MQTTEEKNRATGNAGSMTFEPLDQALRARRTLSHRLGNWRTGDKTTQETAQIIASCLHLGDGSVLERFAATGEITHVRAARRELRFTDLPDEDCEAWRESLDEYLANVTERQSDAEQTAGECR